MKEQSEERVYLPPLPDYSAVVAEAKKRGLQIKETEYGPCLILKFKDNSVEFGAALLVSCIKVIDEIGIDNLALMEGKDFSNRMIDEYMREAA